MNHVEPAAARGEYLLELADWAMAELKGVADYVQVFAESSLEVRVESVDGEVLATCAEPRDGLGCLVHREGSWRYRAVPSTRLDDLPGWLGSAGSGAPPTWQRSADPHGFTPLPVSEWLVPVDGCVPHSIRAVEDFTERTIAVVDSEGVREADVSRTVRQRVEATVTVDGRCFRGLSRWFRRGADESLPHPGGSHISRVALSHAQDSAAAAVSGKHRTPVVFGPSAAAGFLHELVGHALEGDNFALASPYITGLRKPHAIPAALSLRDDPTVAHGYGTYDIDDEGGRASVTTLLENGEIGSPLTSVRIARRSGLRPTANGRRKDFRELAIPRASNTVALPGNDDPARLLEASDTGVLFVGCLGAGMINLNTGEFSFAALNCEFITPAGERVPARDVSLVGDALDTLARLEGIGSDFGGDNVTCGKQGQLVGIGIYAPSMRYAVLDWSAA